MTPERWERLAELFAGAVRVEPAGREAWLRGACGEDGELRAWAPPRRARGGRMAGEPPLKATEPPGRAQAPTENWHSRGAYRPPPLGRTTLGGAAADHLVGAHGFSPKAAIAP